MRAYSLLLCVVALHCAFLSPAAAQDPYAARRAAAIQMAEFGRIEEAIAEFLQILAKAPEDSDAAARVQTLVQLRMPHWLPREVEQAAPFQCELLEWKWRPEEAQPEQPTAAKPPEFRFLITRVGFKAREGERFNELQEEGFPFVDYAYLWQPVRRRWEVRVAVHWLEPDQAALAQHALRATAVNYAVTNELLRFDPTKPWGDPIDLWITKKGEPGARAQGKSIYLYSSQTERAPEEWLRELAHEYGHLALPGIGGFKDTNDPWADGHLMEMLLPKWLGEKGAPEWMPWSAGSWIAQAESERTQVRAHWTQEQAARLIKAPPRVGPPGTVLEPPVPIPAELLGTGEEARAAYLSLALWVEELQGTEALARALRNTPQGDAVKFINAVRMGQATNTPKPVYKANTQTNIDAD
jgi:hypothetical protein